MRLTAGNNEDKVSVGCICDAEMWKIYIYMSYMFLVMILLTIHVNLGLGNKRLEV